MDNAEIKAKLKESDLTAFQAKVLTALMSVPAGKTVSYKELAKMAGHPNAHRAVGTAVKKNPLAPMIPCHRVIKSDGSAGNYSGQGGRKGKIRLLAAEGVRFQAK